MCVNFLLPISIFFVIPDPQQKPLSFCSKKKKGRLFALLLASKINEHLPTADPSNVRVVGFSVGTAARATVLAR